MDRFTRECHPGKDVIVRERLLALCAPVNDFAARLAHDDDMLLGLERLAPGGHIVVLRV